MKSHRRIATWAAIALTLASCSDSGLRRVGYFSDGPGNRILSYEMVTDVTSADVRKDAELQVYAPGQLLAVYYYPRGSAIPSDGITLARSLSVANHVLYDAPGLSRWRYAYMRPINAGPIFVDCDATPKDDLCHK